MKKTRGLFRAGVCALGLVSVVSAAAAEEPSAPPAATGATAPPAAPIAPDLVRLKNGGIYKGTIAELVPNDYVVIVTLTGESRRFVMSDVDYAGPVNEQPKTYPEPEPQPTGAAPAAPASPAPQSPRPAVTVHAAEARVTLTSAPEPLTFHRQAATATVGNPVSGYVGVKGYDELCTSPCEVSMPAGTTTLAASKPGGAPRGAAPVTIPPGHSEVHAVWVDNGRKRNTGRVLAGVGIAGAVTVLAVAVAAGSNDTGMAVGLVSGTVLTSVVFAVGLGMSGTPDSVKFEVRSPAAAAVRRETKLASTEGGRAPGLTLSGTF